MSVAWLHVTFSSMRKTSLFVKLPQEQNVPLPVKQDHDTCPRSMCVCLWVCDGASLVAGWQLSETAVPSLGILTGWLH